MINLPPETFAELERLQTALQLYTQLNYRSSSELIAKKAEALRIELFKGFSAHKWKGSGKGAKYNKGIAFIEMRARAKLGRGFGGGTEVRPDLTTPAANAPTMVYRTFVGKAGRRRKLLVPATERQRLVWTELARRQAGRRVNAVSFLMRNWRNGNWRKDGEAIKAKAMANSRVESGVRIYEQKDFANKRTLGRATVGATQAVIEGYMEAHSTVSNRYAILAGAMRAVREDTEVYLNRKLGGEAFRDCVDAAKST